MSSQTVSLQNRYTYDAAGNRASEYRKGFGTSQFIYNANDQLTKINLPDHYWQDYAYDERGNLISSMSLGHGTVYTTGTFDYDARNQLSNASGIEYSYNHKGQRIQANSDGLNINYLWDEFSYFGDVVLESNANDDYLRTYNLANGMLISQTTGENTATANTEYFLTDVQGSTRALANDAGTISAQYDYDAFGNLSENIATENLATNYLYTGQQFDPATELYSLRARSYDPSIGRFLSQDTWAYNFQNPFELNRYAYAANNPTMYTDPSGHTIVDTTKRYGGIGSLIPTLKDFGDDLYDIYNRLKEIMDWIQTLAGFANFMDMLKDASQTVDDVQEQVEEQEERNEEETPHRVVVLGAGGIGIEGNYYMEDPTSELAPFTQLLAVKLRYPDSQIYAVDLFAGGVQDYVNQGLSPRMQRSIRIFERQAGYEIPTNLPSDVEFDVNEVRTDYESFASDKEGFADVVIAFYPNLAALSAVAIAGNALLKSGGEFYMVTDDPNYIDTLSPLMQLSNVITRELPWGELHFTNPLGLPMFVTAQYVTTAYDMYGVKE
jgi:RHS repeat-associated protein